MDIDTLVLVLVLDLVSIGKLGNWEGKRRCCISRILVWGLVGGIWWVRKRKVWVGLVAGGLVDLTLTYFFLARCCVVWFSDGIYGGFGWCIGRVEFVGWLAS